MIAPQAEVRHRIQYNGRTDGSCACPAAALRHRCMQDMEGYQELMDKLLDTLTPEQVMAHYDPEQRLAGLAPEQRLAGLDRDHQVLALSDELLRVLPDDYLRSLSPEAQAEVRRRLQRNGH